MAFINYTAREINCKIVYYGPGLGGKTTNLKFVHDHSRPDAVGQLLCLATEDDRTLFFDLLPMDVGRLGELTVRFHLYTVPGQESRLTSRRIILRGLDGVVFVADSARSRLAENVASMVELRQELTAQGSPLEGLPFVAQLNKRDLGDAEGTEVLQRELAIGAVPCFEAVAEQGAGVLETLKSVGGLILERLVRESVGR